MPQSYLILVTLCGTSPTFSPWVSNMVDELKCANSLQMELSRSMLFNITTQLLLSTPTIKKSISKTMMLKFSLKQLSELIMPLDNGHGNIAQSSDGSRSQTSSIQQDHNSSNIPTGLITARESFR